MASKPGSIEADHHEDSSLPKAVSLVSLFGNEIQMAFLPHGFIIPLYHTNRNCIKRILIKVSNILKIFITTILICVFHIQYTITHIIYIQTSLKTKQYNIKAITR